jgi:hypothetical protein
VGFQLYYNTVVDTFATYMAPNRGPNQNNTLFVKKTSTWQRPSEILNDTLNTSMDIRTNACLIGINSQPVGENISLYPNPATGKVTLDLGFIITKSLHVKVCDILGRNTAIKPFPVSLNKYELDFTGEPDGVYFVTIQINNSVVVRKVILGR